MKVYPTPHSGPSSLAQCNGTFNKQEGGGAEPVPTTAKKLGLSTFFVLWIGANDKPHLFLLIFPLVTSPPPPPPPVGGAVIILTVIATYTNLYTASFRYIYPMHAHLS
jgi:hypothetical protein